MEELGFRSMDAFVLSLEKNRERRRLVEKLMAVSISRFFRDRKLWETMERHVLPAIIAEGKQEIKVWSAGCASGEEIYSFKILWEEWARNQDWTPELELWTTDMNPQLIERARTGVCSSSSLKEVPEEWRSKYFRPVKANRWAISDFLKEGIHWKVHNL
jgi:chemotaxis protein methyltransferase CheR